MVLIQQITNDKIAMFNHRYEHNSHDMLAKHQNLSVGLPIPYF